MPKFRLKANKLENPTCTFISLVDHGANRVPFRIIKNMEKGMIDLAQVFKGATKANTQPVVVGFGVEKSEFLDDVKGVIQQSGFSAEKPVERDDGTVVFFQGDEVELDHCLIVKMGDSLLVAVDGLDIEALLKDTPVESIYKEHGFVPEARMAMGFMQQALSSALTEGNTEDIAKMESTLAGLSRYVTEQAKYLPASIYKLSDEIEKACKTKRTKDGLVETTCGDAKAVGKMECPDDMEQDKWDAMSEDEKKEHMAKRSATKTDATPPQEPPKQDDSQPPVNAPTQEQLDLIVKEALAAHLSPLTEVTTKMQQTMDALKASVDGLTTQVTTMEAAQKDLAAKVVVVETAAKAANEAVKTTVVGGIPLGDTAYGKGHTVQKTDDDPLSGIFDTAMMPSRARKTLRTS